jgi:hypothetical protein
MSEQDFQAFRQQSNWFMRTKMEENQKEFGLDSFSRFDWDQWRGELVFSSGGIPKVVARIQVVGSLSTRASTWFWAWANSALLAPIRQSVLRVREFGEERGLLTLLQPRWAAKETDAWQMTALTARLTDAKGAFKCTASDGFTFMVFTDIRAVSDRKRIFGAQTCSHVLEEDRPILLVSRELDGEVLAVCGAEDDSPATSRPLSLDQLLALDPTLTSLAGMADGWVALRDSLEHDWVQSKAE